MALTQRKKLDIIVEAHALRHIEKVLADVGVKGWSVFNGIAGAGWHGEWRQDAVDEQGEKRLILAITSAEACEKALAELKTFFEVYPGIVAVSTVEVLRAERF